MIAFDNSHRTDGISLICGVDEAGRGPLAGPVVAAAVVVSASVSIEGVNDSKKLTEHKRNELYDYIISRCGAYSINVNDEKRIDEINILQSSLEAMKNCIDMLTLRPELILVDGNKLFPHEISRKAIVKGDSKSFAIACASILAKVTRDRLMFELHEEYPQYNWKKNKGYPTRDHISAVLEFGPCIYHRKTFLKNISEWEKNEFYKKH